MKILLTGAAGFIGSHLAERLLAAGHDVVGFDSFDTYLYDAATKERNAALLTPNARFRLIRADLCDHGAVADATKGTDLVIHLAALAGVRPSIDDPPRYARANLEGTVNVLEACRHHRVLRLAFASSSSVYGARNAAEVPFREDMPCLTPASPYAATKRAGELLCSTYRDLFGIGVTNLRFFTVYGPRQRPEMAIHKFTRAIAEGKTVTLYGNGESARDYTYIDDIIDGTVAASLGVKAGDYTIYNLGGSRTTTLRRLVDLISSALGKEPQIRWEPDQPGDVPITYADVSRAGKDLGYAPKVPIEEGIKRFVDWFRAQAQAQARRPMP
jgi:UDP-glucuronate 4-epimerase